MADAPVQPEGTPPPPAPKTAASPELLQKIVDAGRLQKLPKDQTPEAKKAADDAALQAAGQLYDAYTAKLPKAEDVAQKHSVIQVLEQQIRDLDDSLSAEVSKILHDPDFQALEASWRGLRYLVFNTETGSGLKLRLLNVKRDTLEKDLNNAVDKDQSALFKKIYEEEYGTYGGKPFSLLIGDLFFKRNPGDFELLNKLASVASAAHTPLIAAAAPELFGMNTFVDLGNPRDMTKIFETMDLIDWRAFRDSEDARYITLTLPRFLLRRPYGEKQIKSENFAMEEIVDVGDDVVERVFDEKGKEIPQPLKDKNYGKFLWGNSAYALGVRITNAFALYKWCAAIRGPAGGGMVSSLPAFTYDTPRGDKVLLCPTEVAITDRREKELNDLGFIALVHRKGEGDAAFFGGQTTHKPKKYDRDDANANAALSARLPYLLAASRFAHYLKVICRDTIGTFQTQETMSLFLNRWIMQYVLATDDAGQEMKAKFPLREARIDVVADASNPGAFSAICYLRPHFQLEELTTSIRLVAKLPAPAAA
jgi:type VI secretion system protein ImpC